MAGGDEVDEWTDEAFAWFDGWGVDVGGFEGVEEGGVPEAMLLDLET